MDRRRRLEAGTCSYRLWVEEGPTDEKRRERGIGERGERDGGY